jgi:signal transduction histidine kinase/PAS domain-containing protein
MSRSARLWLTVAPAALVAGVVASALVFGSDHMDLPRLQGVLTGLTGWSFIAAGLIARTRRPLNRTGLLLIAVGFAWFLGSALMASNDSLFWTLGVALSALPGGFLIHLLLAYPSGRLQSRWERVLVVTGYVLVLVAEVVHLPFEPDPLECEECPSNAFLVSEQETAGDIIMVSVQVFGVAYLLAVVATIVRRWRRSSPAARRALTPVLVAGGTTLFLFAISVGAASLSRPFAEVAAWIGSVVIIGVPFLFLVGLLKSRLARADISRALAEEPTGSAQDRVRQLLHDPNAELLYACAEPKRGYVDVDGGAREAIAEPGRAVTPIEREGRSLAAIVHDEALLDEPELLEQVAATVGLEVERDQNLIALQASERRSRALLEAMPDNMFRISSDGIFLDIQENPASKVRRVQGDVGSSIYDYPVARELIDRAMAAGKRALSTGELQTIEWTLGEGADLRHQEGRFMPSGEDEFFLVVRDVTDRKQHEAEQEALHRVAVAVARAGRTEGIFDLVTEEAGRVLGAHSANLLRYERDGREAVIVGAWSAYGAHSEPVGERYQMRGDTADLVSKPRRPVRLDLDSGTVAPAAAAVMQQWNFNSFIAAPIKVTGRLWGEMGAALTPPHSFPRGAEDRLSAFTRLVSLALANEEAREQLAASRARLVTAGDEERRRLERNLHDGAQQRLVSVSVSLRLAHAKLPSDPSRARELLSGANSELAVALEELRELARGIHPAVLTERGLGPALASLADRAPLPVDLDLPDERLPGPVEAAAYYVVSEALANVAKYARATSVSVRVAQADGRALVEVADDGVGGADPEQGSGLRGLADRVEALEGRLAVASRAGEGTRIHAEIPLPSNTLRKAEGGLAVP